MAHMREKMYTCDGRVFERSLDDGKWYERSREDGMLILPCVDCRKDTRRTDYYMVTRAAWLRAFPDCRGICCVACLEARLGRRLVRADFVDVPLNTLECQIHPMSPELERALQPTDGYEGLSPVDW